MLGFFLFWNCCFDFCKELQQRRLCLRGGGRGGRKKTFLSGWNHSCKCCNQQFIRRTHNTTPTICHAASPCCIWMRSAAWQWAEPLVVSSRKISAVRWRWGSCQILAKQGSWQILFVITHQISCQMRFNWVTSCPRSLPPSPHPHPPRVNAHQSRLCTEQQRK